MSATAELSADPPLSRPALAGWRAARAAVAIEGLPPALAALAPGRAHVVYAEPSPARDALFWQTAAEALRGPATVLATRPAPAIVAALRAHGLDTGSGALHARANLCALRPDPARPGIDVLIEAMQALADQCGARGGMYLIDGAEAAFSWHDAAALAQEGERLAAWCARHRSALLLVLTPPGAGSAPLPALAHGFHARFAGAAQLSHAHGQYTWDVAFWRDGQAVLAGESLPLRFAPHEQRLVVAADTVAGAIEDAGRLAPDEDRVIVSRDVVLRERWVPAHWQIVDSNEAAVASAAQAIAATVVLHYGGNRELETLAEQVHRLRHGGGHALKIVVREGKEAMRQHYEMLMLNLGANLVVAQRTPFARLEAALEGLQGQVFSRPILADYRSALSAVLTTAVSGYVPPATFLELVREALARSRMIHLPNVLLQLPLLPETAHVDALRACRMTRAGDLCSADDDSVYAFFFACRLDDVDAVCRRIFQRPLAGLFRGDLRCGDDESIAMMLRRLENRIAAHPAPDYSGWLASHAPSPETAVPATDASDTAVSGADAADAAPAGDAPAAPDLSGLADALPQADARAAPRAAPQPFAIPLRTGD